MSEALGLEFSESGFDDMRKVLKDESPRVARILNKKLRGIGTDLSRAASARFPGGGSYVVQLLAKGVIVRASGGTGARASRNDWGSDRGVLTAVLESFGSKSANTPQSQSCLATLNARYGTRGRFLNQAWREGRIGYRSQVRVAAAEAERDLQAQLNAAGCGE
jgi:hypothetical protein